MDWTSNEIIHEYSSRSTVTQRVSPVDQELQPFRIIRVHPRLLVGLLLLNLLFSVSCFVDHCLSFCPFFFFGHCIFCPSLIYGFWLPLWYLLTIVFSVLPWFTASGYPFGIFWPLYFLSFLELRLLITPLVSFGHCIVCLSLIYGF